ncbi:MAG TPA: peptidoglycan DD-metalloendopeptidase family protein [Pyrinomonadaceae bacterium]|nr:peptidoglycan DD-metalloendopeptidase family protein [Pyrinomonadaceae bacterium]
MTMKPSFQLPLKCGETWRASTYDGHAPDQNSLDLQRFSGNTNVSANDDVFASAAGTVIEAFDTNSLDEPYGSVITIQHEGEWRSQYVHLDDALSVKKNDKVIRGQKIAKIGGNIAIYGIANAHLHYVQLKGANTVRATFNGVDTAVHAGAPKDAAGHYPLENIVSANCPVPPFGPPVSAVSRNSKCLDVFAIGRDGRVMAAAWEHGLLDVNWRGWWHIQGGLTDTNGHISAVSREPKRLDVFAVGGNGTVYTAAWDENTSSSGWRGWWPIEGLKAPPGSHVGAVSRHPNKLDIFVVGNDGRIYTAAWDQNVSQGKWRGWWNIQDGKNCPAGALVSAVSRHPSKLDVFVVGNDGRIYTAAWDNNVNDAKWRGWWNIQDGKNCPPGAPVGAVSRHSNKLDVFVVGNDGRIYTAAWDQNVGDAKWRGWWNIQEGKNCPPGAPVSAVSRDANKLDVFVVGNDGRIYTAAWDQNVGDAKWRGWWNIQDGKNCPPGAPVSATSRDNDKLDVFVVGNDGMVYTAAWAQNVAQAKWRGWWKIVP